MSRAMAGTTNYLLLAMAAAAVALPACAPKEESAPRPAEHGGIMKENKAPAESSGVAASPAAAPASGYDAAAVVAERAEKDRAFKEMDSPIPAEKRGSFAGLRYFPIDSALAFTLKLERLERPEPFKMAATKGDVRPMR